MYDDGKKERPIDIGESLFSRSLRLTGQLICDWGKVVVTGRAGFVGSHAAEYFARAGHEVVVFDNLSRARILGAPIGNQSYNWNYLKSRYSARMLRKDVRDFQAVQQAFKDASVIIHAAAQVAVTTSFLDPRTDFEVNAFGTFNILEAARLNDSMVVFCSTNKVYGENVNTIPVIEKEMRYSFSDFGFTKA